MPLITVGNGRLHLSGEGILGLARRVGPLIQPGHAAGGLPAIGPLYAIARVTTVAYELATRPVLELWGFHDSPPGSAGARDPVFMGVAWHRLQPELSSIDRAIRALAHAALLALLALLWSPW